jgi:hypothetical protein
MSDPTPDAASPIPERVTLPGRGPDSLGPLALQPPAPARRSTAIALGFAIARERILRRPTALSAALGAALVVTLALIARRVPGAVDRALVGTFRLVIPLVSFGIASEAAGRGHLREGVWSVARYGVSRRDVAAGLIAAAIVASAVVAALYAAASVVIAHDALSPPLARDLLQSVWIAALTASAYTAWFLFGGSFFDKGRGRWAPLVLDFVAGGSLGLFGAILPRGNAMNLLGAAAPMRLSQPASSAILLASVLVLALLAALRCRR